MNNKHPKPFITIIIPTLNEAVCLPKLLNDLKAQTYQNFTVLIVDAQSDDHTIENARAFQEKINITITTSKKRNVAYQRNLGAQVANSTWLYFMDADVRIPSNYLQSLVAYTQEPNPPDIFTTSFNSSINEPAYNTLAQLVSHYSSASVTTKKPFMIEAVLCIKSTTFHQLNGFKIDQIPGEGADLLERAGEMKFKLAHYSKPQYTLSMRRIKKQGFVNSVLRNSLTRLSELSNVELPPEIKSKLYPMKGGSAYE